MDYNDCVKLPVFISVLSIEKNVFLYLYFRNI